jgi:DNA polymerase-3 subunit alpha
MNIIGAETHFSTKASILSPKQLATVAKEQGYRALAVADYMTLNALPILTQNAGDVKVIMGVRLNVVDDLDWEKTDDKSNRDTFTSPILYIMNDEGFKDVTRLLSRAYEDTHIRSGQPRLCWEDVLHTYSLGNVVITTGGIGSIFAHDQREAIIDRIENAIGNDTERFYIECPYADSLYYRQVSKRALNSAQMRSRKVLVSRPTLYAEGMADSRNIMANILNFNTRLDSPFAAAGGSDMGILGRKDGIMKFKKWVHMMKGDGFIDVPGAELLNKAYVHSNGPWADQFSYKWEKMDVSLPSLAANPSAAMTKLCVQGWKERIDKPFLGYKPDVSLIPQYKDRLKRELTILKDMGFEDYFLLVHDLVSWSKQQGIIVGPGRGSVGGSIVAFLMGITDVDPIRFNLFFERFINPERLDLPDIDLDFMSSRLGEVYNYLSDRYGKERVAKISNYGVLGSSSALRSVAKSLGYTEAEMKVAKRIPSNHGQPVSLEEAIEQVPELKDFAKRDPVLFGNAIKLQKVFRNYGVHAAGVIVADTELSNRAIVEKRGENQVINWDKRSCEEFGLVKLDVLGLSTLDLLRLAKDYIKEQDKEDLDYTTIPLEDPEVLKAFGLGETLGVFQFESGGMRGLLRELAENDPLTFEDLSACNALFRPGPLDSGLTDNFKAIKRGYMSPTYPHDSMIPALESTYSVIVYQEQVMQVARDLAGFSMAQADHLRKAMGKKDAEQMAKVRDSWVAGCKSHSQMEETEAAGLFDIIEKFAGYGFNKSHSVEYAIIAFWAMWLKVYKPEAFFAAALTILGEDKRMGLVKDAERRGVYVMPPDVNISTSRFEIGYDSNRKRRVIYAPFQMVKGLTQNASEHIMECREKAGGSFTSFAHFLENITNKRYVNKRIQSMLDDIGVFAGIENQDDPLHPTRLKSQKAAMPGIMLAAVKADRKLDLQPHVIDELSKEVEKYSMKAENELAIEISLAPRLGKNPRVMVIYDNGNFKDEKMGKIGEGDYADFILPGFKAAGYKRSDLYQTALIKANKTKDMPEDYVSEMIRVYGPSLKREIELLNPAVVLIMGTKARNYLLPEVQGGFEQLAGQVEYDHGQDTSYVIGINPNMCFFDDSRRELIDEAVAQVVDILD